MLDCIEWACFVIGLWALFKGFLELLNIFKAFIAKTDFSLYGAKSWVLITGATDGIGLGFAENFAGLGFNLILVARNHEKLAKVAAELENKHKILTKCVVKDFSLASKNPAEFFSDLKSKTDGFDISILVNNVGTGTGSNIFHKLAEKNIHNSITLNIFPIVYLTKLYLPDLLSRKHRSAIINLASVQSLFKLPFNSVYCAGKSFDDLFTLVVSEEARFLAKNNNKNIDVLSLRPGYVETPLTRSIKWKPLLINTQECVQGCLKSLSRVTYTSAHWKHHLLASSIMLAPNLFSNMMLLMISRRAKKD